MRAPPSSDPNDPGSLGPVLDFMRRLWAVDHALHSLSKRMETRMGLTGPQRLVVRIVGRFPGINAGQLAGILHVHPSTLTGVLARLEDRGLVTRRADPTDLRRALFTLTARGRGLDQPRSGTVEAALETTLAALPERNIRIAEQVLAQIADALSLDVPLAGRNGRSARPAATPARTGATPARTAGTPARTGATPARTAGTPARTAAAAARPAATPARPAATPARTAAGPARTAAPARSAAKAPVKKKRAAPPAVAPARAPRGRNAPARVGATSRTASGAARKGS